MSPKEQKAVEEAFLKQQQLFETYSKTVLNTLQNMGKKYTGVIEDGTEKHRTNLDKGARSMAGSWGRLFDRISLGFSNMLRDMTREAGRPGGFGDIGVDAGKKIGASLGQMFATRLGSKFGAISPALGKQLGSMLGGGVIAGLQSLEGLRMMGAKFMPVITAGQQQRSDFGAAGSQMVQRVNEVRLATGATREEVFGLAAELSKLGIPFDQTGEKASRYALSADKVLNLSKGTVQAMDALVIAKYGQSWEDVGQILKGVSASTAYWNWTAKQTNSSLAVSLSSNETLSKMYMEVATAMQGTSIESKSMADVLTATVGVMGQMGLRPGMMSSVSKEFMQKLAPKTGGFMSMVSQGYFLSDLLRRSDRGMQLLAGARGVAERMKLDPNLVTIPLNQMLASNDAMSGQFFQAMLEGISSVRAGMPGTEAEKTTSALFRLEGTFGVSPTTGYVMMTMADQYKENLNRGMRPEEAWHAIGKSKAYQDATATAKMPGMDPEEVLRIASGMGAASLSTQEKLSMAAESLMAMTGEAFWSKFRSDGKILFEQAARMLRPAEAAAAVAPATPAVPPTPATPAGQQFMDMPAAGPVANPPRPTLKAAPVFSYTKSTSRGVEQVTTTVEEGGTRDIMEALAAVESRGSGDYGAVGPLVTSGMYKGERALGRYQVMPGNLPEWSREALGREVSPQEFLASPAAQDKIVEHQIKKNYEKYGNVEDVASVWHSGRPLAKAQQRSDVLGTATPDYVRRVVANLPRRGVG